jgi:hypothetical protein
MARLNAPIYKAFSIIESLTAFTVLSIIFSITYLSIGWSITSNQFKKKEFASNFIESDSSIWEWKENMNLLDTQMVGGYVFKRELVVYDTSIDLCRKRIIVFDDKNTMILIYDKILLCK